MRTTTKNFFSQIILISLSLFFVSCTPFGQESNIQFSLAPVYKGSPDPLFGDSYGQMAIELSADVGIFKDTIWSSAIQPDHKVLIAGWKGAGATSDGFLIRRNPDGSVDTSFNGTGEFVYDGSGWRDFFYDVKIFQNKIFIFGLSRSNGTSASSRAVIIKLNMDGTLDTSFATAGVWNNAVYTDTAASFAGEILSDGKILALTYANDSGTYKYAVVKLESNGTFDTSFGSSGKVTVQNSGNTVQSTGALRVDSAGRIVVYYSPGNAGAYKAALARLNSNGTLDTTFGTNGIRDTNLGDHSYGIGLIVTDQAIFAAGSQFFSASYRGFVLKLNSSGNFDPTFADNGLFFMPPSLFTFGSYLNDLVLYGDNIYIGGAEMVTTDVTWSDYDMVVAALNKDTGTAFLDFGIDGYFRPRTPGLGRTMRSLKNDGDVLWAFGHTGAKTLNQSLSIGKLK